MRSYSDENRYVAEKRSEINIKEVFQTIARYRWSILLITLFSALLAVVLLYFQPQIYNSYAIIKVKTNSESKDKDLILKTITGSDAVDIKEDITLLKTFYMNNQALERDKTDFQVQYYVTKKYKEFELYDLLPIKITDIEILDEDLLGKKLILFPQKDGYKLQFKHSIKEKIVSKVLRKSLPKIKKEDNFAYRETVSTEYFKFKVEKLSNIKRPIHFVIHGNNRHIYETIIKNNLSISQLEEDVSIIKIAYKDNIQKRAISYINSLTDIFIQESINNKNEQNNKVLEFIEEQLVSMKRKLEKSEKELEVYRVSNKVIQPSVQATTFIQELSNIEIKLSENELKQRLIQNLIHFVEGNYNLDAIAPSLMELNDNPTLELIQVLQATELKKSELSAEFTDRHPEMKILNNKIVNIRSKILSNIQNLSKHISQKSLSLKKLKSSYEENLKTLPVKERKLINIKRAYEVSSKMYDFLLEKRAENKIVKAATLSDYKIIDKAYSSPSPIAPNYPIVLIAAMILGLISGIILAFIRNGLNNSIKSIEELTEQINLPLYGQIPLLKKSNIGLEVYKQIDSLFTESYRALRTNLQLSGLKKNDSNIILFSSTTAGEGKSTTVANMGAIFQIAGYKTILIDLEMRKPTLHQIFNLNSPLIGVSGYLRGEEKLEDIIYPTHHRNLDVIPVGIAPSNPSELIISSRLPKLLDQLKGQYEYILINSTPFGLITDTKHILPFSDLTLVVLRENYTKKVSISNLKSILQQDEIKNMGMVLIQE